jgi:hypothetical protein
MISEGVDIRRLRVLVYATNVVTELAFRQITGRVVRSDARNGEDDYGLVVLPADGRLLAMVERILDEIPPVKRAPLVLCDPRVGPIFRSGQRLQEFVPLGSTGELAIVVDTSGRSAPAELVAAATFYVEASGSTIPPFEIALAANNDRQLRARLMSYRAEWIRESDRSLQGPE